MPTVTKPYFAIALLGISLLLPTVGMAESPAFKVCADPNNPPFSDRNGQGFENRIAELLAAETGSQLEYTWFPQRIGFIRNTLKFPLPKSQGKGYKCDVVMGVPTGYELTATTQTYYQSTYALVYRKSPALDGIHSAADIYQLPQEQKQTLRIAMFDGAPGTSWLIRHGLAAQGIPYQSMTGDAEVNTAQTLERDFRAEKIDMVIIWGPIAGYLETRLPGALTVIPLRSEPGIRMEFPISMGVRVPDKQRKEALNTLLSRNADKIRNILLDYHVPLVSPTE